LQILIGSGRFVGQKILLVKQFRVSCFKTKKPESGKLETRNRLSVLKPGTRNQKLPSRYATFAILMSSTPQPEPDPEPLYCPRCTQEVTDPLTCGDCSAVICRRCGTPLESPDELGMG
jgi:hypothetical protein